MNKILKDMGLKEISITENGISLKGVCTPKDMRRAKRRAEKNGKTNR